MTHHTFEPISAFTQKEKPISLESETERKKNRKK